MHSLFAGLAGFYDPNLFIIGNPEMTDFHLLRWGLNNPDIDSAAFEDTESCVHKNIFFTDEYGVAHKIPIFSQVDTSDGAFPITYYRVRFKPQDYSSSKNKPIFGVVGLEDRLLLTTVVSKLDSAFSNLFPYARFQF